MGQPSKSTTGAASSVLARIKVAVLLVKLTWSPKARPKKLQDALDGGDIAQGGVAEEDHVLSIEGNI